MIYMFLSNNPSSGDINSSNLSCYRRNLGWVSHVQAMDKARESIVVAALTRFLSHCQVQIH